MTTHAEAMTGSPDFVISRVFDAPRDLVWKVFTDPAHMKGWWGPKGFTVFSSKMDFRVGGFYHYGMTAPDGSSMWGKLTYREIAPKDRMVLVSSFSDEAGGVSRHPLHMSWPLQLLTTFTFEEQPGGKTRFTVRWQALNATAEEQKTFDGNHDSMRMGWTGTLEQLAAYLARA
jgi:uncharacterized protein YndB with AHSA1/START domain